VEVRVKSGNLFELSARGVTVIERKEEFEEVHEFVEILVLIYNI
jgi:hypothetical protein